MRTYLFASLLALPLAAQETRPDEKAALKERFKERFPTLRDLRKEGRIGETHTGFAEAVKAEYLDQKVDPKNASSETIRQFLEKENGDRRRLYELFAKKQGLTPAAIGTQDAIRRSREAEPDHWLKTPSGKWVQKKDTKPPR
jgi:uncharacterized protein YdbL (DUF1318 family)